MKIRFALFETTGRHIDRAIVASAQALAHTAHAVLRGTAVTANFVSEGRRELCSVYCMIMALLSITLGLILAEKVGWDVLEQNPGYWTPSVVIWLVGVAHAIVAFKPKIVVG